jgi:hypothetical protein
MSKLARTLMLCAMLAAMSLAVASASAQEGTAARDPVELFRASERTSQEHRSDVGTAPAEAALPARPAEPGGRLGLLATLGVLAAVLVAVTATRATRRVRARQAI